MNNINVTIELCAEDRARLDNLTKAIEALTPVKPSHDLALAPVKQEEPKQEAPKKEEPKQESPAQVEPTPTPEPEKPAAAPAPWDEVTTAELQSKVVKLVSAGKKDEARGIVMEYAKSVSDIPAEKRAEVMERLSALEGWAYGRKTSSCLLIGTHHGRA